MSENSPAERARRAANARWAKEAIYKRIETIAAGLRAANPKLTEAQSVSQAVSQNPQLYSEYVMAASSQPAMTHAEMREAYEQEIRDLCTLADQPTMAKHFIAQGTHPRDVTKYLLATKGGKRTK